MKTDVDTQAHDGLDLARVFMLSVRAIVIPEPHKKMHCGGCEDQYVPSLTYSAVCTQRLCLYPPTARITLALTEVVFSPLRLPPLFKS